VKRSVMNEWTMSGLALCGGRQARPGGHGLAGDRVVLVPAGECGDHHAGRQMIRDRSVEPDAAVEGRPGQP
jgi:hypothetical protein